MENATKALLIAAGMLFAIMTLTLLVLGYNEISSYYSSKQKTIEAEQLAELNSKFTNYDRKKIRGSDIISLMNRVIDYNERESYVEGTGYRRIAITIDIGTNSVLNQFKYDTTKTTNEFLTTKITNVIASGNNKIADEKLILITSTVSNLNTNLGMSISEDDYQTLSANIANILLSTSEETGNTEDNLKKRIKRKKILDSVGISINVDGNYKTKNASKPLLEKVKNAVNQYYQYMQFKRAYFDCVEMKIDEQTGRVSEMKFKVRKNASGQVEFN